MDCLNIFLGFHRNSVNKKIELLFITVNFTLKMQVSYYRISFPGYYPTNDYDCPIDYFFKKYSLNNYLPLPRAKKYLNDEYVAVIPISIEDSFINIIVKEEDCKATLLKKENYNHKDFENTYVYEVYEKVGGINSIELSIFKRL